MTGILEAGTVEGMTDEEKRKADEAAAAAKAEADRKAREAADAAARSSGAGAGAGTGGAMDELLKFNKRLVEQNDILIGEIRRGRRNEPAKPATGGGSGEGGGVPKEGSGAAATGGGFKIIWPWQWGRRKPEEKK